MAAAAGVPLPGGVAAMARDGVGPWSVAASGSDAEVISGSSESVAPTVSDSEDDLTARMAAASPVRALLTLEGVAAGDHEDHEVVLPRLLPDDSDGSSESSTTPRGPRAGGDRPGPQPGRRLLTIWQIGLQEASLCWEAALGVSFHYVEENGLEAHFSAIVHQKHDFYIGGTSSPAWRWVGGESARGDGPMRGHRERFHHMHVAHIARAGHAGQVEARLIQWGLQTYSTKCVNLTADSRGLLRAQPNFIYVCFRF